MRTYFTIFFLFTDLIPECIHVCSDSVLIFKSLYSQSFFGFVSLYNSINYIYTQYFAKLISGLTKFMGRNC